MNPDFWRGKRVFITGHTGFKGSWIALWLQRLGAEVTGFALEPIGNPCLYETANVAYGMNSIIGDIRNMPELLGALNLAKPQILIHMAAQSLVKYSYIHPVETYETNVMGTVNILEAIRRVKGISSVLIVTSDKCYATEEVSKPYVESDMMGGLDPYSSSKSCTELITSSYRSSFFDHTQTSSDNVFIASARAGNVVGGGDWACDRLVPDAIRAFTKNQTVLIRHPKSIRPWQHVLEPLKGYLVLCEKLYRHGSSYAEAWNFGPQNKQNFTVQCVVERIAKLWGENATWTLERDHTIAKEISSLKLDSTKSEIRLDYSGVWDFNKTLEATVDWYKAYDNGKNMREFSSNQIDNFVSSGGQNNIDQKISNA